MSKRHRRTQQPTVTRGKPQMPAGARQRAITNAQVSPNAIYGDNTTPVAVINGPQQQQTNTFLPGTPVIATPGIGPRAYEYVVGGNIAPAPRHEDPVSFAMLRALARNYYGIGLCEDVHNRIIQRLEPRLVLRDGVLADGEDAGSSKWATPGRRMAEWLLDGPNYLHDGWDLHGWLGALNRDLCEIDAASIFHRRTRAGDLFGLQLIDGGTIQVLNALDGSLPIDDEPAYRQVVYGAPGVAFTRADMDYLQYTTRTDDKYGIAPVQRILLMVNIALRMEEFDLRRWTDGSSPSGVLWTTNQEYANWTPEQVRLYQETWNNILAGNSATRVRNQVLLPGWQFSKTEPEQPTNEFDRWLLNICAAAFGVSMDELGFTETSNRSVGQSQEAATYRNAVKPRSDYLARYLSRVIRRYDGTPLSPRDTTVSRPNSPTKSLGTWDARYKVEWGGIEEPEDIQAKSAAVQNEFKAGIISRLEAKAALGYAVKPDEEDTPPFTYTQGGITSVFTMDMVKDVMQQLQEDRAQKKAQADAATQQQQLIDKQMQAQQEQQSEEPDFGEEPEEGEGDQGNGGPEGEEPPPEPPAPPAPKGGGARGKKASKSAAPSDDTGNEDDAAAEVDNLIQSAKGKGRTAKRMQAVEDDDDPEMDGERRGGGGRGDTQRGAGAATVDDGLRVYDSAADVVSGANRGPDSEYASPERDAGSRSREWQSWYAKALKAAKAGQAQAMWRVDSLPVPLATYAQTRLQGVVTPDAVRAVFAEVKALEQGEQDRIFGFGGGGHQDGKTQEVHGPNGRIVGNISLSEHAADGKLGTGTKGSVPTHDRGHGAHVSWDVGSTYHEDGQHVHSRAEAQTLMRDFFGRDLADHEVAALVGAQPGFHVIVKMSDHSRYTGGPGAEHSSFERTPALAFEVHGQVRQNPSAYSAHRLLFREADGTLTMGNADSNLTMGRGHGLGIHIFKDQVAALSHFNVARLETSANGNHHTLARGGTSGFYTWARFGFNGPINWKFITQDLRANHLPPVGREYRAAKTTADLMKMPGGAAEWKRIGESFHGVFDLTPGSDSMRILEGYLAEKGIAFDSTFASTALPFEHAWEQQRAAMSGDAVAGDMPPDLTPEDEAILDRVWASLATDHEHQFIEQRCMVCGCGQPANDHGLVYPVQEGEPNTGCMVAFFLPGHVGQLLAQPGGEPMQDLHITLAFLGDTSVQDIDCDALCACVKAFAATRYPLPFSISGVGRFQNNGKDQEAVYAAVSSDALMAFRQDLVKALIAAGFAPDTTFSYTPHVTLCYVTQDDPTPDIRLPTVEATLPYLWVAYQDRRFAYELTGGQQAALDEIRELRADVARAMKAEY